MLVSTFSTLHMVHHHPSAVRELWDCKDFLGFFLVQCRIFWIIEVVVYWLLEFHHFVWSTYFPFLELRDFKEFRKYFSGSLLHFLNWQYVGS